MFLKIKRIAEQPKKINFSLVGYFGLYQDGDLILVDHSLVDIFDFCLDACDGFELIDCLSELNVFDLAVLLEGLENFFSVHSDFLIRNGFLSELRQYIEGRSKC